VTRIVAGIARGRVLAVPPRGTRPTSDRTREALFSTLAGLVELAGIEVLDLYAGTGAVGLEALSRGAVRATLVESDRTVLRVLRRNVDTVGLAGAEVVERTVAGYLADSAGVARAGLAFLDPPYALDDAELAGVLDGLSALPSGAVVVVERSARGAAAPWPNVIESVKQKRYGDSVLWYGRRR
jgi:16S rRNA (guanine966-N2)-methyltransferase